ncbi:MAG: lactonase family protein [Silvibacterium sp.]|nr:lactonase family protein [Silvibacterium sp.]
MISNVSRRKVLKGLGAVPFVAHAWWRGMAERSGASTLFVGTQTKGSSKGIYAYRWDAAKGEIELMGLAAEVENPTFLALSPNAKFLYAANEVSSFQGQKGGGVSSFVVDAKAGKLTAINAVSAKGAGTCHVTLDQTGQAVFCANYDGGSATSFHVKPDGGLTEAVSFLQYSGHGPNAERQEAPHAHRVTVTPDNKYVLVNDLGLDCIHIYNLDAATAKLTPHDPAEWKSEPGAGPRALRFHPNGRWAYCVEEMASAVTVLRWDAQAGTLTTVQTVSLIPEGYHGEHNASEIVLDRAGRFAYAADRFDDVLVSFRVDPTTGRLTKLGSSKYGGKTPRHIALDPTEQWMLVANQGSDNISVVKRGAKTGLLAETGKEFPIVKPQCLVFV